MTRFFMKMKQRQILYEMCKNDHMHPSDVKEGKIELIADCNGLLKVDKEN